MNWGVEGWIKLYVRDNGDWLRLSFDAQGVLLLLFRKVDRHGKLDLGRDGVAALPSILGHRQESERICNAVLQLVTDGCVTVTDGELLIPNFETAQAARTSNAERQRRFRELHRESNGALQAVTARNDQNRIDQTRSEKKKLVASELAPGSPFQEFLLSEWPDIKKPAEYERRSAEAYPRLDLLAEARKARGWETANPRKAKSNHGNFLWRWLGRAQKFAAENEPDAGGKRKADVGAARSLEETKQRNAALAAIKSVAPPKEFLASLTAKIGNGK